MAGGHGNGHGVTYGGLTLHSAKRWHKAWGTGLCSVMWYVACAVLESRVSWFRIVLRLTGVATWMAFMAGSGFFIVQRRMDQLFW